MGEVTIGIYTNKKICPCGAPLKDHKTCDGCSILLQVPGNNSGSFEHSFELIEFRGKNLCRLCVRDWKKKDKELGRQARWVEIRDIIPPGYRRCPHCSAVVLKYREVCEECQRFFPMPPWQREQNRKRREERQEKKVSSG